MTVSTNAERDMDEHSDAERQPADDPPRVGSAVARAAAAIGGVVTLVVSATFTMGTSLFAPLGVLGARSLAKRRGGRLTRGPAWLGAALASVIGVPLVFGFMLTKAPPGTVASIRSAMDSAQAERKDAELPEWLQRVTPPGAQQQNAATRDMMTSGPLLAIFAVLGIVAFCSMFGTIAGSIGWVASMLLGYAITGRWIPGGDPPRLAPIVDE
jgi:hypothetical protein